MQLSEHFTLEEMTASATALRHGLPNKPDDVVFKNLQRLAKHMEAVRSAIGKPIIITSGYRSPEVNKLVGSKDTSQHCIGCAVDFKVHGMTPDDIVAEIIAAGVPFDQLIREFNSWVHFSIPNSSGQPWRMQALIIDALGARPFPARIEPPVRKSSMFDMFFGKKN